MIKNKSLVSKVLTCIRIALTIAFIGSLPYLTTSKQAFLLLLGLATMFYGQAVSMQKKWMLDLVFFLGTATAIFFTHKYYGTWIQVVPLLLYAAYVEIKHYSSCSLQAKGRN